MAASLLPTGGTPVSRNHLAISAVRIKRKHSASSTRLPLRSVFYCAVEDRNIEVSKRRNARWSKFLASPLRSPLLGATGALYSDAWA